MAPDEIASNIKKIYELKKEIVGFAQQRNQEELALAVEYKVDECNTKRRAVAKKYEDLTVEALNQIKAIEESLGTKI